MELRYLVRSNHLGKPERVLQYMTHHENGYDWKDVPTAYTEEVMNDHHDKWPDNYKIQEVKYLNNIVDNYEVS